MNTYTKPFCAEKSPSAWKSAPATLLLNDDATGRKDQIRSTLDFLPGLYPGGDRWLDRKLIDIGNERARCLFAIVGDKVGGVAIETPKTVGVVKLSTFYVAPDARSQGIGALMLSAITSRWAFEGWSRAYVTVAATKVAELEPLLKKFDFVCQTIHEGRYGVSRDEFIYEWRKVR